MSKDWEIFTAEDATHSIGNCKEYISISRANYIFKERGQLGHCQVSDYGITTTKISNNQHTNDTHQALVFLRPIEEEEEEVVECDHTCGWGNRNNGSLYVKFNFCPECGADLR